MSSFGWNLPPGCSYSDLPGNQPDFPCEVCGKMPDACICPECPECGQFGNPECYTKHGLVMTQEQIDSLGAAKAEWAAQAEADNAYAEELERLENQDKKD